MIEPARVVNREFWRAQACKPRVVTFITAGRCRSAIGPHDMTEDECLRALHQAALHQVEGGKR